MSDKTIESEIAGTVWKIEVKPGDRVGEDDTIIILESMKMEVPVAAPCAGTVLSIAVGEGDAVTDGQVLVVIRS